MRKVMREAVVYLGKACMQRESTQVNEECKERNQ